MARNPADGFEVREATDPATAIEAALDDAMVDDRDRVQQAALMAQAQTQQTVQSATYAATLDDEAYDVDVSRAADEQADADDAARRKAEAEAEQEAADKAEHDAAEAHAKEVADAEAEDAAEAADAEAESHADDAADGH